MRGPLKLVRSLGEPDLVYDVDSDPRRVESHEHRRRRAGTRAADERWDLDQIDAVVRESQEQRRLVVSALTTGALAAWDHPGTPDGPYIRTGDDFWSTLEAARKP